MTSGVLQTGVYDRLPPHSIEAEQSVLGAMMLSNKAIAEITEILRPEDFYKDAHRKIFETAYSLYAMGEPVDPLTMAEALRAKGQLESVGDRPYLHTLVSSVPTTANALYYAQIVEKMATLRRLIDAANQIIALGYEVPEDVTEALDRAENLIYQVSKTGRDEKMSSLKSLIEPAYDEIIHLYNVGKPITGLSTGFPDLDRKTTGLHASSLIIVAARPSVGKTSLALNIAEHVALEEKKPVAIFSLEMSAKELVQRMLCSQARINSQDLRTGRLEENDWRKLTMAVNRLAEAPIFVDDNAGITIMELRSKIRRLKSKYNLGLVIIDYIQLMSYDRRMENRQQEISAISRSLKIIGRDFDIPVLAVSQLSREPEKRKGEDRRPILSDLRESGAIEQDADLIIFIFREELYEPDNDDVKGLAELIIAKNRHGPTGKCSLTFQKEYTRFDSMPSSSLTE